jgi:hypothetical protein
MLDKETRKAVPKILIENLATAVGSTAAIVGLGAAFAANTAVPVVAAIVAGSGTLVAAGALYRKLTEEKLHPPQAGSDNARGSVRRAD